MKNSRCNDIMTALVLWLALMLTCIKADARDFESDGIFFRITSEEPASCSVTGRHSNCYEGVLTIPESVVSDGVSYEVTGIDPWAFDSCVSLVAINIPNSVNAIGSCAFIGCSSLAEICLPESVTAIPDAAFYGCSSLQKVNIPAGVQSMGYSAFFGCASLAEISLPDGVDRIEYSTFSGCSSLVSVRLPESLRFIGEGAFRECVMLKCVDFPNRLKTIGDWSFFGCRSLASVVLPNRVQSVGYSAFYGCTSLASASLGGGLYEIKDWVFYGCDALAEVTNLSADPQDIGDETFTRYGVLHVVEGFRHLYESADYWKEFTIIDDIPEGTGIEGVRVMHNFSVLSSDNSITIKGIEPDGMKVSLLTVDGRHLGSQYAKDGMARFSVTLPAGTVVVIGMGNSSGVKICL